MFDFAASRMGSVGAMISPARRQACRIRRDFETVCRRLEFIINNSPFGCIRVPEATAVAVRVGVV